MAEEKRKDNLLEHRIDDKTAKDIMSFLVRRAGCECFRLDSFKHIDDQPCMSFVLILDKSKKPDFRSFLEHGVNLHWNDKLTGLQTLFLPKSLDMHVKFLSKMLEVAETANIWFYTGNFYTKTFLDKGETLESVLMSRDLNEGVVQSYGCRKSRDS